MASIPEQIKAAAVSDTLAAARTEAEWPKLAWASARGTFGSGSVGWKPEAYAAHEPDGSRSGDYWAAGGEFTGGAAFVAFDIQNTYSLNNTAEFRSFGLWLFTTGTGSSNGYQLRMQQASSGTGTPHKYKFMLSKYVSGTRTLIEETKEVTIETSGGFALAVRNGILTMWRRETSSSAWVQVGSSHADSTFTKGYAAIDGNGSNPTLTNFKAGPLAETYVVKATANTPAHIPWTFVLAQRDGTPINEVRNATDRNVVMSLNKPSTASFTVRPDNPLLVPLFGEDTLLKVYEGTSLRFFGHVVSNELAMQEDGAQATIKVNAADSAWRLSRRLLGLSSGGTKFTGDKAKIAYKMINELNTGGETGIKLLAESEYDAAGEGEYIAGPYKAALGCINDLAHGFDGFDWYMAPLDNTTAKLNTFEAKGVFGSTKAATFEHGFGQKNIKTLNYVRDLSGLANIAYHLVDAAETEHKEAKKAEDAASIAYRGKYETVADALNLVDSNLRQDWVNAVVRVRKNPRYVVAMTIDIDDGTGRVPALKTDYWLGDLVQARSVIGDVTVFDGKVRVYQIQIAVNEAGTATITPVLIDEEGTEL